MKTIIAITVLSFATVIQAADFNSSPYNYQNSESNYENSSSNFKNSPSNYENSPYNSNSRNGIYDNSGNRTGYAVPKSDGGVNLYNNSGHRYGYKPAND